MNVIYKPIAIDKVAMFFGLPPDALAEHGVRRLDAPPGAPCRLTLEDAPIGEPVLLLTYTHQESGPYKASGPIFVAENAREVEPQRNVPESFRSRLFSARSYNSDGWMLDAEVIEGQNLESGLNNLFHYPGAAYVHLHHARRGCFACRVERA